MSKKIILTLLIFLTASNLSRAADPARFFRAGDLIHSGTYYYPEHWPQEQWERDIKRVSELGFDFIHFGEFAWAAMEPEEGRYEFDWLDRAVALAGQYGLKVVMCSPSPCPPAWLTHKHPDVLCVNEAGQRIQHGARQQASWASDTYREYVQKIVLQLAHRYGGNPHVWGWQIDNEPSHYKFSYEYSDNNREKFTRWLQAKYDTIERLNDAWGTAFWSETYNDFDQIAIPNQSRLPGKANPHAMLDFKRFTADMAASFINFQADLLRDNVSPEQWITTNTMPAHAAVDPSRMNRLDFLTYTRYLVHSDNMGHGEQGFRISQPEMIGWSNDFYRNIKGITGVMEIQPGQVNWGTLNPQTYPGAVRLWYYHIMAGGNKLVCHYRFRQPLKGSEQYHYGMMQTDGITVSHTGEEILQFNREMDILRKNYDPKAKMPKKLQNIRTAILINPDNRWEMDFQPQTNQWSSTGHFEKYYNIVKSFGAPVDIVEEGVDFEDWPVMIAPAYQLLDRELVARWEQYVRQGGQLVITCRTGQKNRSAHLWEAPFAEPIHNLIGAQSLFFDHLPNSVWGTVGMDGASYRWNNWADVVIPDGTSEVWSSYDDQFYKGRAAVTHKKIGKGTVTFIGADTDDGELEKAVLKKIYQTKDRIMALPPGVIVEWRDGFWFGLNYTSDNYLFTLSSRSDILIGEPNTPPAGVVVWKEK